MALQRDWVLAGTSTELDLFRAYYDAAIPRPGVTSRPPAQDCSGATARPGPVLRAHDGIVALLVPAALGLSRRMRRRNSDWQDRALCAQTDPDAFFPEKGGSTREAKRVCRACEVRAECLEYALEHDERFGIWGGLSERERRRMEPVTAPVYRQPLPVPARAEAAPHREKTCCRCGQPTDVTEFSRDMYRADGRRGECKACGSGKTAAAA